MVWSPESCEVKVKRPSDGPRVLTTLWPVSTSCYRKRNVLQCLIAENARVYETHVNFYKDPEVGILNIFLVRF